MGGTDYDSSSPRWRRVYNEAMENGYRFLSYGDACLLFRASADPTDY
ncbi:MAG: S-adenosylmethionine:tRNA ribosyltransferase-isomerase [Muribaculaceae bacterium]|nr:S-adenosylmethionine:tRNA ribosyltransferase-isomerase [Muribaculaceae bacterium]